jgi:hypothetical protein
VEANRYRPIYARKGERKRDIGERESKGKRKIKKDGERGDRFRLIPVLTLKTNYASSVICKQACNAYIGA